MSTVDVAAWDVDPDQWPHTPPLDVWRALYEDDDNLVWRAGIGHVVNALDEALERLEVAEGAVERVRGLIDELQRLALPGMTPWDYAEDFRAALDGGAQ